MKQKVYGHVPNLLIHILRHHLPQLLSAAVCPCGSVRPRSPPVTTAHGAGEKNEKIN